MYAVPAHTAEVLDGKLTRDEILADSPGVAALTAAGRTPGPRYRAGRRRPGVARLRPRKALRLRQGRITSIRRDLPADISQAQLNETIDELNADPACTGYIVQLPLPRHLDENAALERIDPKGDDGLHPTSRALVPNEKAPLPCVAARHRAPVAPLRGTGSTARMSW